MTDLFDNVSVPHQRHSDTSVEAAGKAKAKFKGNLLKVLKAFVHYDRLGLTDEQGCEALRMDGKSNRNAHIYRITMDGKLEASRYE